YLLLGCAPHCDIPDPPPPPNATTCRPRWGGVMAASVKKLSGLWPRLAYRVIDSSRTRIVHSGGQSKFTVVSAHEMHRTRNVGHHSEFPTTMNPGPSHATFG